MLSRIITALVACAWHALPAALTLDDPDGPHARHLGRQAGLVDHFNNLIDILVRPGLLLRKALAALSAGDDAARLQFLVDAAAGGVLDGGGAAHRPARPVAGGAERPRHAPRLADE